MELAVYEAEARAEADHWWFVGRRRLFEREIRRMSIARDAAVVDVGTSTGTNLRLLRGMAFENIRGLDLSETAAAFCRQKGLGEVRIGDICAMPFATDSIDLLLATDVVEHVDDDARAIAEIHRVLRPGGKALFTVPAFPSLWGLQDEVSHHRRRYRMSPFLDLVARAGLRVERSYHFNFLLFLPIWLARKAMRFTGSQARSENDLTPGWINTVLTAVFDIDTRLAPMLRLPFGVSLLCVASKPAGAAAGSSGRPAAADSISPERAQLPLEAANRENSSA